MNSPGRSCPLHYRYSPEVFAKSSELRAHTLYIAGGLYGNTAALAALQRMLKPGDTLVFNGDFNWFNVDAKDFAAINETVLRHVALRGNVETELASESPDAGCGCAYPASVSDAEVERSNRILARLRLTARAYPALRDSLAALPMHCVAQVGRLRIGIVHGDAHSLAGWHFAHDALHASDSDQALAATFVYAGVRVFASSHTCLPALRTLDAPKGASAVINNGAAGMPNFSGTHFGIATRISTTACPQGVRLYGTCIDGVYIDAVKVDYDHAAFLAQFAASWPAGSDAHTSYCSRISNGPAFATRQALGTDVREQTMRAAS